jgi:urease accessory protein UreF
MAKGDKKKSKTKIPKEVGGVKVSKSLRKAGNKALKLASEPAVSETVAAALLAAAAALRDPARTKRNAAAAADTAGAASQEALKMGDTLRKLAIDMARRTLDAWENSEPKRRGGEGGGGGRTGGAGN